MLIHLSAERFKNDVFDFTYSSDWEFKGLSPAIILFQNGENLYQKGFRDVYDPLSNEYAGIKFYQVLIGEDPVLAAVFSLTIFPSTVFIPIKGKPFSVDGFLPQDEVRRNIEQYLIV